MKHQYRITIFHTIDILKPGDTIDLLAYNPKIALNVALEFISLNPMLNSGDICTIKIERLD